MLYNRAFQGKLREKKNSQNGPLAFWNRSYANSPRCGFNIGNNNRQSGDTPLVSEIETRVTNLIQSTLLHLIAATLDARDRVRLNPSIEPSIVSSVSGVSVRREKFFSPLLRSNARGSAVFRDCVAGSANESE